jgi:hypothetical protein
LAAQSLSLAFLAAVNTEALIKKIYEKRRTAVVTRKAIEVSPVALDAGTLPGYHDKKIAALMTAQEVGKMTPMTVEAGAPPGRDDKKMAAPLAEQDAGKMPQMVVGAEAPPVQVC